MFQKFTNNFAQKSREISANATGRDLTMHALGILETCMIETLKLRIYEDPNVSVVMGMCNL